MSPRLPAVDRILQWPAVCALIDRHGRSAVLAGVRELLSEERAAARAGEPPAPWRSTPADVQERLGEVLGQRLDRAAVPHLKPVFNLTGTVLHTNLGRAPLAAEACTQAAQLMGTACNLEFDLASGERGERDELVEDLLTQLTGAEAATVVNNNAAAVLLVIAALAARRQVLVSRGELVEIGGAFRMPDVMAAAGAKMVEVGTTNRTHAHDFAQAITPRTALLFKAHTSNYVIQGFTHSVPEAELATLAHAHGLPFVVDLGSGSLVDLAAYGLPPEPTVQSALAAGCDLLTFSGDKLLGGPQAGLIVGRRDLVARVRRHPLKRALRVGKLTLAALEATLRLYRHPEQLAARLPALRLLTRPGAEIADLAVRLAPSLASALGTAWSVRCQAMHSQIGSGSLPVDRLPSAGLAIASTQPVRRHGSALAALAAALRGLPRPVIGRIHEQQLWLDLRCLDDPEAWLAQLPELSRSLAP